MAKHSGEAKEVSEQMRAIEKGSCSSWVVEMEKMLDHANPSVEMARWKQQSIYRVPEFIKKITKGDAYQPQFVSLGPLHHGETHLQPMEEHKRRAVLHMVNRTGKPIQEFVAAIEEVADELQGAYGDLDDNWRGANKGRFVEMMVTDGCFLLELIRTDTIFSDQGGIQEKIDDDYATNDPIFSVGSYIQLWPVMLCDMIAMENQIPLLVLHRLSAVWSGTALSAEVINNMVFCLLLPPFQEGLLDSQQLGLHCLDIYHSAYRGVRPYLEGLDAYEPRTPCAVELSEAGIQFNKSSTDNIHATDFENGVLSMPLFKFDDDTETIFLNLMAFEWLHPDAKHQHQVASYISFVDKIIESERDVALLRSSGLFENMTGSDKKVVETFNILTRLATTPDPGSWQGHVQWKVSAYCRKRRNRWRAIFVNTYLSNPWVFISLVAAIILLAATLLQTVYTIVPFYTKS